MDISSFKKLFNSYYRPLCHFANGITQDSDLAEDIVQEVFIYLWNKNPVIESESKIKALLFTSVRNKAVDALRKKIVQDKHHHNIRWMLSEHTIEVSEEDIDKFMLIDKIYISIRQLPPKCGEVFTLCKVNGLSYAQISEQLNISVKTVENHMQKAFKILREMLAQPENKTK